MLAVVLVIDIVFQEADHRFGILRQFVPQLLASAAVDGAVKAFLHIDAEGALATARDVDRRRIAGEELHILAGVPPLKSAGMASAVLTTALVRPCCILASAS